MSRMKKKLEINSRKTMEELMLMLLNPLKPYYSEEKAFLRLGVNSAHFPDESAWIEGFSRPLWGLAPFWAGGGRDAEFEAIYRRGFVAGTDPESDEYWGKCYDYDQRLVEMAAMGYTMLLSPEQVWEPLSEKEKGQVSDWLNEINRNKCCDCNWRFFRLL